MRFVILFVTAFLALTTTTVQSKRIVCYYGSWSTYRPGEGKFEIEDIDPNYCSHLIYTFVGLDGDEVRVLDPWQDLPDNYGRNGFERFNDLRNRNPKLKTMISMGGWNEGSAKYSAMASDANARSRFVKNVLTFVKKYNFNGFDLAWSFPGQRGGNPSDYKNYVLLIKELRETLSPHGILLSAAVASTESAASIAYDIPQLSKYLHFINLMTYDFHGSWQSQTGLNAPLYSSHGSPKQLTTDAAVNYWLSKGAEPEKLNLGIAFYGRSFTLVDSAENDIGAPALGPGTAGPYTREPGVLGYNEICELQINQLWTSKETVEDHVPYCVHRDQWVGYDDVKSITFKALYIKEKKLGGAMVWSIETDDFRGNCGSKYPLLSSIESSFKS